jgi:hypothetical protein
MTAATVVPRQPSNHHVIEQAKAWGWREQGQKRGKIRLLHAITNDTIYVEPPGSGMRKGNRASVLAELYHLTGVNAEGFWQGPSRIDIKNITNTETRLKEKRAPRRDEPVTTKLGDVLAEAAAKAAADQTKTTKETAVSDSQPKPIVAPPPKTDVGAVTPVNDSGREAILTAAKLPGGASIRNQAFSVLAKSGMPMSLDDVLTELPHLERFQVGQGLSGLAEAGNITRVKRGVYVTNAAPVTDRSRVDVVSPDGHHVELNALRDPVKETRRPAMAEMPPAPTASPRQFQDCGADCRIGGEHTRNEDCVLATVPTVPPPAPAPAMPESPVMAVLAEEDLDELFDLLFPDGVTIRARHIAVIAAWRKATTDMVHELTKDD